jgi:hypothetical protein
MIIKKFIICGTIFFPLIVFATENEGTIAPKTSVDILGAIGVTVYSDFPSYNSLDNTTNIPYVGYNMSLTGLYSLFETKLGSPVIGGGISFAKATGNTSKSLNYSDRTTFDFKKGEISSTFLELNGGFKFFGFSEFSIFTLLNLGYSVSDSGSASDNFTIFYNNNTQSFDQYEQNELTISNHYKYGVSVLATYALSNNIGIGLGATFNQHKMTVSGNSSLNTNNITKTLSIPNTTSTFNETSLNAIISYSL